MNNSAAEMRAFDALPGAVRAALAASRFDFLPSTIAADRRAHRLDAAETVAFIHALESWAAEAEREAQSVTDCNRLTPAKPPRVDEMVDRLRAAECDSSDSPSPSRRQNCATPVPTNRDSQ